MSEQLSGNLRRTGFYICPACGNIIQSMGPGEFSCCGAPLQRLDPRDGSGELHVEVIDGENYITMDHPMTKDHYITFFAYVTTDRVYFKKMYPEQEAACAFPRKGLATVYACCNQHGLLSIRVK